MGLFGLWKSSTPTATSDDSTPPSSIPSTPTSTPPETPLTPSPASSLPPSPPSSRSHSPTRHRRFSSSNATSLPEDDNLLTIPDHYYTPRLQMPLPPRLLLSNIIAGSAGFFLGAGVGSRKAALRFRAENAHRFPKSQKQWYFYHKSKNYYVLLNGAKEGVLGSLRIAGITSLYLCMEELVDDARCQVDALGSTIAGVTTGGVYAYLGGFPSSAIAKTAKRGAWLGLWYGVAQDVVRVLSGERVFYMDPLIRVLLRDGREGDGL